LVNKILEFLEKRSSVSSSKHCESSPRLAAHVSYVGCTGRYDLYACGIWWSPISDNARFRRQLDKGRLRRFTYLRNSY